LSKTIQGITGGDVCMDKILDIASQWMGLADSDGNGTLSR